MDKNNIASALVTYFGFLVALTMREGAQAHCSKMLGDKSATTATRATLNPIPHIDPFGTVLFPLLMLISGINMLLGWAKRFDPDSRYFKKMKRDLNIVYLAGPGANVVIAIVAGITLKIMLNFVGQGAGVGGLLGLADAESLRANPIPHFLMSVGRANLIIAIFNIIPVPNTDGWKLLLNNVNYNRAQKLQEMATPISMVFLLLLILGVFSPIFGFFLGMYQMLLQL
jgi:Zn-dependent protease